MKSIAHHLPAVERLYEGQPIIEKLGSHPWENKVTFNPACAHVKDRKELQSIIPCLPFDDRTKRRLSSQPSLCFVLYRAQGKRTESYDYTRSSIGLAVLGPDLRLLARHDEPVLMPDQPYDNLGVEDARITKVGDEYVMFYTAYSSGIPENTIRAAIATTRDFVHWSKHGLLNGAFNSIDNKNMMLFEEKVDGKFVMLHRPMKGPDAMSIHWATGDHIFGEWTSRGVLMRPIPNAEFVDTWVGGGAPPLRLPDGRFLIIYHIGNRRADTTREYDLGIAIADFSAREIITKRNEPLLRPAAPAETKGDAELGVNNVLFVCGAYLHSGELLFPYAGADSVVLGGRIPKGELERYLAKR